MKNKGTYIDRVVLNLKHTYGKDELVAHLQKELSEAKVEIGQLKAEIEHLKHFNAKENQIVYQEILTKAENRFKDRAIKAEKDFTVLKKNHDELLKKHCEQYHNNQ